MRFVGLSRLSATKSRNPALKRATFSQVFKNIYTYLNYDILAKVQKLCRHRLGIGGQTPPPLPHRRKVNILVKFFLRVI